MPPVTQAPASVTFENWQPIRQDDISDEFEARFQSAIVTPYPENNTVRLKILRPADRLGPTPVVIVLHYWGAFNESLERSFAAQLNRSGIAAILMPLPLHLSRTPHGYKSGELAVQADPTRLIETMTQAVSDVRRTVDFIASRSEFVPGKIGLAGTSLGAIVASLAFAVEPRIAASSYLVGGADLAGILWNSSRVVTQRESLRRRGFDEAKLRAALEPIEPLRFLSGHDSRPSYVIGGRFDTVVPRANTEALIKGLGTTRVSWMDSGHVGGLISQRSVLRSLAEFFASTFEGRSMIERSSFVMPTLRAGMTLSQFNGLQVGIGFDLWRTPVGSRLFGTILATPRGPQVFGGYQLQSGLSVGVIASPRRISPGLFWSIVL